MDVFAEDLSELQKYVATFSPEQKKELDAILAADLESQAALGSLPRGWEPRFYQKEAWNYLQGGGKRACLVWHRRCLASGTRVALADGRWAPIEELEPGQEILSWDCHGIVRDKIVSVWCAGLKEVTEFKASGFPAIEATADHRFYGFHAQWWEAGWVEASEISRRRLAVGQYDSVPQGDVDAGELAELVGYLVTDGYVTNNQQPKFTNVNRDLCNRVANLAVDIFGIHPKFRPKGRGFDVGLSNGKLGGGENKNPLNEWFAAGDAVCSKSRRRLPSQVWTWNDSSIWRFLGSVIDGDGSIYAQRDARSVCDAKRGPRAIKPAAQISIHAGESRELANGYMALLRKVGVVSSVKKQTKGENWIVRITRQDCIKRFLSSIVTLSKESKRLAALSLCSNRRERQTNFGCEKTLLVAGQKRSEITWDLETERHHCFFANGYLVHNSGKDDLALNWTACAAHQRVGEYWHMLPEASQARKAIWDAVSPHTGIRRIDQAFPEDLREKTREQDMVIRFKCGSLWRVVGSDNYESLLGSTPAGIVLSEWALADPNAWAFLRPILMENDGWALFITTPRGANHARKTLDLARSDPSWFAQVLSAEETKVFTPEQLATELKEYQHDYGEEEGQALFEQEYNCSFASALVGSYYGSHLNRATKDGRIVSEIPIDRTVPVHTAWDLGRSDSTAIWFIQRAGLKYLLVDYHEASGLGLDEYAKILDDKRAKHRWVYGKHYFPHDMAVHEWGNKVSRVDTAKQLGYTPIIVPQHHDMDGVNAVRRMLDATWIDETRCERGLNALRNFRRAWDDKTKMFRDKYLHDWASHGAKALETFAMGFRDVKPKPEAKPVPIRPFNQRGTGWMGS